MKAIAFAILLAAVQIESGLLELKHGNRPIDGMSAIYSLSLFAGFIFSVIFG